MQGWGILVKIKWNQAQGVKALRFQIIMSLDACVTQAAYNGLKILRYHNRVRALPNSRLDKLALFDGFWDINPPHRVEALSGNWRSDVRRFTDTHGQQIVYDELDISNIVEREKRVGLRTFFLTQSIAACNSIGLSTKPIIQSTSMLTICLLSDAIPTGD